MPNSVVTFALIKITQGQPGEEGDPVNTSRPSCMEASGKLRVSYALQVGQIFPLFFVIAAPPLRIFPFQKLYFKNRVGSLATLVFLRGLKTTTYFFRYFYIENKEINFFVPDKKLRYFWC